LIACFWVIETAQEFKVANTMRCIFCKRDSADSPSVEHIIPEALGNTEHVLPRGIVCDGCNNYFARKIEGPLLETLWFKHARSRQGIESKRGLIPPFKALIPAARAAANVWLEPGNISIGAVKEKDEAQLYEALVSGRARRLFIPIIETIDEALMSRFLAKVALEIFAEGVMHIPGWEDTVIDDPQLDPLRRFARIGDQPALWPYSRRRIYGEDDVQMERHGGYQILHEFTMYYTPKQELYAVVCLFGEEFALNYAGPEIEGYTTWLNENDGKSPLYLQNTLPTPSSSVR
jgi:hypothetical protein